MIDAIQLGKLLAEEVINDPGPCFYPAKFKPPHKGHYKVAKELASRSYITKLHIIISGKTIDGITAQDSLAIWQMYIGNDPNITVEAAKEGESPILKIMSYLRQNPTVDPVYVAASDDEKDDENYIESLQSEFGNRVVEIKIHDKDGLVTSPHVRTLLQAGDYEKFSQTIPEEAYNKGAAPVIFKMLAPKITQDSNEPE